MTLKERIENNLIIWLLGTLLTGFLAGIGTYQAILEIAKLEVVPEGGAASTSATLSQPSPKVELSPDLKSELERLTEAHNARLQALHAKLLEAEKEATSFANIDSQQEKYRQSAERLQAAIKEENESYSAHLQALLQVGTK